MLLFQFSFISIPYHLQVLYQSHTISKFALGDKSGFLACMQYGRVGGEIKEFYQN